VRIAKGGYGFTEALQQAYLYNLASRSKLFAIRCASRHPGGKSGIAASKWVFVLSPNWEGSIRVFSLIVRGRENARGNGKQIGP
jgi:hypothetical protein